MRSTTSEKKNGMPARLQRPTEKRKRTEGHQTFKKVSGGNDWFPIKAKMDVRDSFAGFSLDERLPISGVAAVPTYHGPRYEHHVEAAATGNAQMSATQPDRKVLFKSRI